jgi:hypothetical protein
MSTPATRRVLPVPQEFPQSDIWALFQELIDLMGDRWTSANVYATVEASAIQCGVTCSDIAGNQVTYTQRILGPRVSLSPPGANLAGGETQQFTAAVLNPDGSPIAGAGVAWKLSEGALGTVDANGLYAAPARVAGPSTEYLTATYQESGSFATATVSLHA